MSQGNWAGHWKSHLNCMYSYVQFVHVCSKGLSVKRNNLLYSEMETFNSMMPVTIDEGDIGERSNNRHNGPTGWHRELALSSIFKGVGNNTNKRGWGLKHVPTTILCVLV